MIDSTTLIIPPRFGRGFTIAEYRQFIAVKMSLRARNEAALAELQREDNNYKCFDV